MHDLLISKKTWVTLASVISALILYSTHGITSEQLANIISASFGVLVFSIAHQANGSVAVTTNVNKHGLNGAPVPDVVPVAIDVPPPEENTQ